MGPLFRWGIHQNRAAVQATDDSIRCEPGHVPSKSDGRNPDEFCQFVDPQHPARTELGHYAVAAPIREQMHCHVDHFTHFGTALRVL